MLLKYMVIVMKQTIGFVTKQQLLVQAAFLVFFLCWQWKTGVLHFNSIEGFCRTLWPYCAVLTFFWCVLCWQAGKLLNEQLRGDQMSSPVLWQHDHTPIPRKHVGVQGQLMAVVFCIPVLVAFFFVTWEWMLWVQPWGIRPSSASIPDYYAYIAPLTRNWRPRQQSRQASSQSGDSLVVSAEEMSRELCTFANTWEEQTIPLRRQYQQDIEKGMPQQQASALLHARLGNQSREMRMVYAQIYKDRAVELRGKLMERVHDLGDLGSSVDYSLETNGIAKQFGGQDDIAFARMDMQAVCRNFSDLVMKYRSVAGARHEN